MGTSGGWPAIYDFNWSSGYDYLDKLTEIINHEGERGYSYSCPEGYRMPNHAELLIMHAYGDTWANGLDPEKDYIFKPDASSLYIAKNAFSYRNKKPYVNAASAPNPAFVISRNDYTTTGNVALANKGMGENYGLKVRCVRDIE